MKKLIISILAAVSILIAIYGVWQWQNKQSNLPIRQTQEIRE